MTTAFIESESPDALDVFEHAMLTLDSRFYDGSVALELSAQELEHELSLNGNDWLEASTDMQTMRCFVGHALVVAPRLTGRSWDMNGAMGIESFVATAYDVPRNLVRHIFMGVCNLRFADGVAFVKDTINAYRNGDNLPDHSQYES